MVFPAKAGIYVTHQPQPPRSSGRQPNQSQKSPKSNESQFKTKRPPPATTQPPPPVFPAKPGTHAPSPPSVYPRVAVDATPPIRLSGESRNLRHPPTATPSKLRAATKPVPKITQIKRITVQDQAPPTSHHATTPTRLSSETRNPIPHSTLRTPNSALRTPHSQFQILPDTRHFPTRNTPLYHNDSQTRNIPPGHADQIQPATEAIRCPDVRKPRQDQPLSTCPPTR